MDTGTSEQIGGFSRAIAEAIEALRLEKGILQEDIASAIGRSQTYVSYRVTCKHPWNSDDLDNLAPLFGLDSYELIEAARKKAKLPTTGLPADTAHAMNTSTARRDGG